MKNEVVKIEGTHLIREVSSMGLSNLDQVAKNDYYSKVQLIKTQKQEINSIKSELFNVKNDISEIKQLLTQLLKK